MANNSKQVAETILRYTVDDKSIRRALAANEEVENVFGQTSKAELTAADAAQKLNQQFAQLSRSKALTGLTNETIRLGNETTDWSRALSFVSDELSNIGASEDEIRRVADALADAQDASKNISAPDLTNTRSSGGNRLETIDRLGSVGSQLLGGVGASQLGGVAGLVGDIAGGVSSLGAFGIAAAALAPVIATVTSAVEQNTAREKARADALQKVAEAIVSGTYAQIDAQITALEAENAVREVQIGLIEEQTGRSREYLTELTKPDFNDFSLVGGIADLVDTINGLGGPAGTVVEANATIEENTFLIEALNKVLEDNATATNDMIEYENTLAQERVAAANEGIQREIEHQQLLRSGTAEGVRDRIQGLQDEFDATIAANQALIASGDTSEEAAQQMYEFAQRTTDLLVQMGDLKDNILPVLEATEQLAAAEKTRTELADQMFEAQQREGEARDKARQALEDYIKAEFAHEATLAEIQTDADTKREKAETDNAEQRLKLEQQTSKKITEIVKKTNATLSNAIAARDVLAYILAKQAQEDQIAQEKDAYAEREKELEDSLKKQLDEQEKANREAINRENQRWSEERNTRVRAQQQIAIDLQNAQAQVRAIQQNSNAVTISLMAQRALYEQGKYQEMSSTAAFYLDYMVNKSNAAFQSLASVIQSPARGIGSASTTRAMPTPFAFGGDVTRTGLALVHEGERIYTPIEPAGRRPLPANMTTNQSIGGPVFNLSGMTRAQVIEEVTNKLYEFLDRSGLIQG